MADVLVLCYHAVSPTWSADLSVRPDEFARQLDSVLDRGYQAATLRDAIHDPPARRVVAVTFDDAFESVHRLAWPILRERAMPATLFVPTGFPDAGGGLSWPGIEHWADGEHADELRSCGWDQIAELRDAGWEIGSHTVTHPHLTRLADGPLARELAASKAELEQRLDAPCRTVAYPYGDVDARVVAAAAAAGYDTGAGLTERWVRSPHPLEWPRLGVYHDDDLATFARRSSGGHRRLTASPVWPMARGAYRLGRRLRGGGGPPSR